MEDTGIKTFALGNNTLVAVFVSKSTLVMAFLMMGNIRQKRETGSGGDDNKPKRYINIPVPHCFGPQKKFLNLLETPPSNSECCLSNKVAMRPAALNVCCKTYADGAEEGGYLSQCPAVTRQNRQRTQPEIFGQDL